MRVKLHMAWKPHSEQMSFCAESDGVEGSWWDDWVVGSVVRVEESGWPFVKSFLLHELFSILEVACD